MGTAVISVTQTKVLEPAHLSPWSMSWPAHYKAYIRKNLPSSSLWTFWTQFYFSGEKVGGEAQRGKLGKCLAFIPESYFQTFKISTIYAEKICRGCQSGLVISYLWLLSLGIRSFPSGRNSACRWDISLNSTSSWWLMGTMILGVSFRQGGLGITKPEWYV